MADSPPLNRFYVRLSDDLDALARRLPVMLRSMEPGDSVAFRRLDDDASHDFEVISTKPGADLNGGDRG